MSGKRIVFQSDGSGYGEKIENLEKMKLYEIILDGEIRILSS